ncbi:MAG: carbohydrate kinase family protein [Ferrovum sp.]|nr:carbohydrate kinase family protein [Ferrovum sp.]
MSILLCGSLAFDTIMVFPDRFKNHILPDRIHQLSVAFLVPEMRREFGGTAGNIAYNLRLLGDEPHILATVGEDFAPYRDRLFSLGLNQSGVRVIPEYYTAQAFITTDLYDNQITAFHPGAMSASHLNTIDRVEGVTLGVVSPDGREGMIQHAQQFKAAGIPFLFDPGQGLPLFSGPELLEFLDQASYLAVNDYEAQMMVEKTGIPFEQLAQRVLAAIVTKGSQGSTIHTDQGALNIPAVPPETLCDPTGCGDAYRAGLLYGLARGWEWAKSGRLASLMGSLKIAHQGGQNHTPSRDYIARKFQEGFGLSLD